MAFPPGTQKFNTSKVDSLCKNEAWAIKGFVWSTSERRQYTISAQNKGLLFAAPNSNNNNILFYVLFLQIRAHSHYWQSKRSTHTVNSRGNLKKWDFKDDFKNVFVDLTLLGRLYQTDGAAWEKDLRPSRRVLAHRTGKTDKLYRELLLSAGLPTLIFFSFLFFSLSLSKYSPNTTDWPWRVMLNSNAWVNDACSLCICRLAIKFSCVVFIA